MHWDVDLAGDPRYGETLVALQSELQNASNSYFQSPGNEKSDHAADVWARAHGGFWGPWCGLLCCLHHAFAVTAGHTAGEMA